MRIGDKVLVTEDDKADRIGIYRGDLRDSGYFVASVELADGTMIKPWHCDIHSIEVLKERHRKAINRVKDIIALIHRFEYVECLTNK